MARRGRQGSLDFPTQRTWGGARRNAGRKPRGAKAMVAHQARETVSPKEPRHVTLRLLGKLPNLRGKRSYRAVRGAFEAARERLGMRLVHWSVQGNHLHLIVEAKDRVALSRGMQGLKIRLAKALNRLWGRAGSVFSDRYHAVALRTPRQQLPKARGTARTAAAAQLRRSALDGAGFRRMEEAAAHSFDLENDAEELAARQGLAQVGAPVRSCRALDASMNPARPAPNRRSRPGPAQPWRTADSGAVGCPGRPEEKAESPLPARGDPAITAQGCQGTGGARPRPGGEGQVGNSVPLGPVGGRTEA